MRPSCAPRAPGRRAAAPPAVAAPAARTSNTPMAAWRTSGLGSLSPASADSVALSPAEQRRAGRAPRRARWRTRPGSRRAARARWSRRARRGRPTANAWRNPGSPSSGAGSACAFRAAAQAGVRSSWHWLQAFGTPSVVAQVGPRNAEAVVVARVHDHVGRGRACGRRRTAHPACLARGSDARSCRTSTRGGTARRRHCPPRAASRRAARGSRRRSRPSSTCGSRGTSPSCRPRRAAGRPGK